MEKGEWRSNLAALVCYSFSFSDLVSVVEK